MFQKSDKGYQITLVTKTNDKAKFKHDNMFEGFGRVYNKQTYKQT